MKVVSNLRFMHGGYVSHADVPLTPSPSPPDKLPAIGSSAVNARLHHQACCVVGKLVWGRGEQEGVLAAVSE
jgi:hypothetical protein